MLPSAERGNFGQGLAISLQTQSLTQGFSTIKLLPCKRTDKCLSKCLITVRAMIYCLILLLCFPGY